VPSARENPPIAAGGKIRERGGVEFGREVRSGLGEYGTQFRIAQRCKIVSGAF